MKLFDFLTDLIFPNRCGFCNDFIVWDKYVCDDCISKLEFANNFIRFDDNNVFKLCVSVVRYDGIAKDGILNFKHPEGINVAKYLVPILCDNLAKAGISDKIDFVTAVPVIKKRFAERKYNHAEVIAKLIAKSIAVDEDYELLGRNKTAKSQHELSRLERIEAVKGRYFIKNKNPDIKGKTILLCDDIITTGSTLSECAKLLLEAGAKEVYSCTLVTTMNND